MSAFVLESLTSCALLSTCLDTTVRRPAQRKAMSANSDYRQVPDEEQDPLKAPMQPCSAGHAASSNSLDAALLYQIAGELMSPMAAQEVGRCYQFLTIIAISIETWSRGFGVV